MNVKSVWKVGYNSITIIGYDHHCPWTSKCVGSGNLKSFYIFVAFTMVLFGYLIFSVSLISSNIENNQIY
jgi:hypothetical protein